MNAPVATSPTSTHSTDYRRELAINLVLDLIAPTALFYGLRASGVDQWWSLLLSAIPPTARAVQTIVTKRKVDVLAVFTLSVLVFSVAVSFVSGSPRFLLAKDGWITAVIGAWILGTVPRKPFLFQVVHTLLSPAARERAEINWRDSPTYRHVLRVTTTMWGTVLILDAGVRMVLAYTLPVDKVPLIGGLQFIGVYLALETITRLYARRKSVATAVEAESGQKYMAG